MAHRKAPATDDALLLSKEEARALLGIGGGSFDRLLISGEINVIRFGKRGLRIPRAELDRYIARSVEPWSVAP